MLPVVKLLLLSGANASARTRGGALPYHLAGLQFVRTMITDMGGPGAVPADGDTIDMVSVLRELTMPDCCEMVATERPDGTCSPFPSPPPHSHAASPHRCAWVGAVLCRVQGP